MQHEAMKPVSQHQGQSRQWHTCFACAEADRALPSGCWSREHVQGTTCQVRFHSCQVLSAFSWAPMQQLSNVGLNRQGLGVATQEPVMSSKSLFMTATQVWSFIQTVKLIIALTCTISASSSDIMARKCKTCCTVRPITSAACTDVLFHRILWLPQQLDGLRQVVGTYERSERFFRASVEGALIADGDQLRAFVSSMWYEAARAASPSTVLAHLPPALPGSPDEPCMCVPQRTGCLHCRPS